MTNVRNISVFAVALLVASTAYGQDLEQLLRLAGVRSENFVNQFNLVRSTEKVDQTRMDSRGKVVQRQSAEFDYVATIQIQDGSARVEESRLGRGGKSADPAGPEFVTDGFAALILIFHPEFQNSFSFAAAPSLDRNAERAVEFELRPSARSTTVFRFHDRNYPIDWKGVAWIDPATGGIRRISATMKNPIADLGLQSIEANVEYAPFRFSEWAETLWLPTTAGIALTTRRQQWKDVHRFRDFELFTVRTSTGGTP